MKLSSRSNLFLLLASAVVILAIVSWSLRSSWLSAHHLQALHLNLAVQANDLPDDAQILLTRMNGILLASSLGAPKEEELEPEFEEYAVAFRLLLESAIETADQRHAQRQLATDILPRFESYRAAGQQLIADAQQSPSSPDRYARTKPIRNQGEAILLDLSRASQVNEQALEDTFRQYHASYDRLALLLILLPGFCLMLAGATIFVTLQNHVSSLRLDLSQAKLAQAKQEKLALLGTMASGVAHEIRNPLTAIKARLFVLERMLEPSDRAWSHAHEISHEISRLDRIAKEFLTFGRPARPDLRPVPVRDLLQRLGDLFRDELAQRKLALGISPAPEDLQVRADPEQAAQILINLVRNAADASKPGDVIRLLAEPADVPKGKRNSPGPQVAIRVIDQGSGISPEIAEQLFTPFFSSKANGVGLGLSIAKQIAQLHEGDLTFESKEGEGSTFTLLLPAASSQQTASPPASLAASP